jgi:mRNA-degrading endonuclease RelE of RelBE toxin-antitoxin system
LFQLFLTKSFSKELKKLEKQEKERVKKRINDFEKKPWAYFQRLTGHELFRARVGSYRIIAQINKKKIYLISIKHRQKSYRKL